MSTGLSVIYLVAYELFQPPDNLFTVFHNLLQNVKNSIVARVDSLMYNLLIHELNHAMGFSYGLFSAL